MSNPGQASTSRSLPMARSMCWHCQSEVHGEYFCDRCVKVQPLSKELDYFTFLGLPRHLHIDPALLEETFYKLSRTFHPDFFQTKTESEQAISLGNAALLNSAYRTLKDPLRRAEYLISLEAGSVKDIRTSPPADLFEEILSLQEDLEAFRAALRTDEANTLADLRQRLDRDRLHLEERQKAMETRLMELFTAWDHLEIHTPQGDAKKAEKDRLLKEMREILSNRTYLSNILSDLATALDVAA